MMIECDVKGRRFVEKVSDVRVLFQLIDVGLQLFVWVCTEPQLRSLCETGLDFELSVEMRNVHYSENSLLYLL